MSTQLTIKNQDKEGRLKSIRDLSRNLVQSKELPKSIEVAIRDLDKSAYLQAIQDLNRHRNPRYQFEDLLITPIHKIMMDPYDVESNEFRLFCIHALGVLDSTFGVNINWKAVLTDMDTYMKITSPFNNSRGVNVSTKMPALMKLLDKNATDIAIEDLNTAVFKVLLGSFKRFDVNTEVSDKGANLFMMALASYNCDEHTIKAFLDHGADPMQKTKQYGYAFQYMNFVADHIKKGFPTATLEKLIVLHEHGVPLHLKSAYKSATDYHGYFDMTHLKGNRFESLLDELDMLSKSHLLSLKHLIVKYQDFIQRCANEAEANQAIAPHDLVNKRKRPGSSL